MSWELKRQIGLLIDRKGYVYRVILGDAHSIFIPDLGRLRHGLGRLRGLRLIHTHLGESGLDQEDIMDMVFLRLDFVSVLNVDHLGRPTYFQWAHLMPPNPKDDLYVVNDRVPWDKIDVDFASLIESLESEFKRTEEGFSLSSEERAILISVGTEPKHIQLSALKELESLAITAGLKVMESVVQRVSKENPNFILGKGKLAELEVIALQNNASILIFNKELTPTQMRNLADITERKVLDRTQLILDIFAQHAKTKAGKLQVELAQLEYTLPRLTKKNKALSRLTGGIGGRGPGETKLELDKRRIKERRSRIKKELAKLRRQRSLVRKRRKKEEVFVVSLVGYTNAGKSTLLNTLTNSNIYTADKLFATLDPTSRQLYLGADYKVVITDTVGFIRYLPENLREAFLATLEELSEADLLIHVADASHPEVEMQIESVESILKDLNLHNIPIILVLNKWDLVEDEKGLILKNIYPEAIPITALDRSSLGPLLSEIKKSLPINNRKKSFMYISQEGVPLIDVQF